MILTESLSKEFKDFIDIWENSDLDKMQGEDLEVKNVRKILSTVKYQDKRAYDNKELHLLQPPINMLNTFITSTMGWIHCNPSKQDTIDLANEAFVFPDNQRKDIDRKDIKREDLDILNTKSGMNYFFNYLINKNNDGNMVFIVGKKGIGKTYTQNYFLNTRTKDLLAHNITWFRIDLTKVLNYQKRYSKKLPLIQYLYTQIVYVYFRYGLDGNVNLKNRLLLKLKKLRWITYYKKLTLKDYQYQYCEFDKKFNQDTVLSKIKYSQVINKAKILYMQDDFFLKLEKIKKQSLKYYTRKDGLNKPYGDKDIVYAIAKSIIDSLYENNDSFLLFIDGIDNVDYNIDENLNNWIDEIYQGDILEILQSSKIVLTSRPETLDYISARLNIKKYANSPNIVNIKFKLDLVSEKKVFKNICIPIIEKKFNDYPQLTKKLEESGLDKALIENMESSILIDFYQFGLKFSSYISLAIRKRHNLEIKSEEVLDKIYNGSLRDMIYDIKDAYMYNYYFLYEKALRERKKRQDVSIYIEEKKESRCFLVLASMSRHGCIYFNDTNIFTPPYLLLHSFNLFNFINLRDYLGTSYKDMFLPILILNILKTKTMFLDDILEYCHQEGFLNKEIIKMIEKKMLENGLLELDFKGVLAGKWHKIPRRITARGKYALTAVEDMDILHSFSYEMYFPELFINKGLVIAHKNNLDDYSLAQISNVLSILKILQICKEKNNIKGLGIYNFFNNNIKEQLIRFASSMRPHEVKEIIKKFQIFINDYSTQKLYCSISKEDLIKQFQNKIISYEAFDKKMRECGYS